RDATFSNNHYGGVRSLAVLPDGRILAGGAFPGGIMRLLPAGARDPAMTFTANDTVFDLALQADGKWLACGEFTFFGGVARPGLIRINPDDSPDLDFEPDPDGTVIHQLVIQADAKILL